MNRESGEIPHSTLPRSAEDDLDVYLCELADEGVAVVIPIETGERPTLPPSSEAERLSRERIANEVAEEILKISPQEMFEIAQKAAEDNKIWRRAKGYPDLGKPQEEARTRPSFLRFLNL